jgi:pimeloyl-ACP methyl ester carboxylesterase
VSGSLDEKFVEVGGIRTFYVEKGVGPPVVLIHGGGMGIDAKLTWLKNVDALSANLHVIAFDQVGFGRSDMPSSNANFTRLARLKHSLALLDRLKIGKAILVGHSEGGLIATIIAAQRPDKVRKLVIVASGSTAPRLGGKRDQAWIRAANQAYDWELEASSEENYLKNFKQTMLYDPRRLADRVLRRNYRQAKRSGNMRLYLDLPPEERDFKAYYSVQEKYVFPYLPHMKIPTLLVWANNDLTVPVERGIRLMEMIPSAELHVFDKAKHMVMIDRATAFNALVKGFCIS